MVGNVFGAALAFHMHPPTQERDRSRPHETGDTGKFGEFQATILEQHRGSLLLGRYTENTWGGIDNSSEAEGK